MLKVGVNAQNDAIELEKWYRVICKGLINLEVMVKERGDKERSLEGLVNRYGDRDLVLEKTRKKNQENGL